MIPRDEYDRAEAFAVRRAQKLARRLPHWIDTDVLENTARLAVWHASGSYQPGRCGFPTYAHLVANRELLEEVRRQSPWGRPAQATQQALYRAGETMPGWLLPPLWLGVACGGDDEGDTLGDLLPAAHDLEREALARVQWERCARLMTARQREVLMAVVGREENGVDVARRLGLSQTRVVQLKQDALERGRLAG